ncbi:hypothetical protein BU16DRAFT_520980 [Lophium mytilinum]|uniref:Uncharacterized protein n=1 Tax=Lophium mytilinum TaxID=390894 RepID=A0A6A6REN6_9PEZI|nr:hypothetical protein BU16DRAFT_520980 [Lophium mytilinum]
MTANPESCLMAAPAEIRQRILQNLSTTEIRIKENGDISNMPWQVLSVCKLLKEDVDAIQKLWIPLQDAKFLVTSPGVLRLLPSMIEQLKKKATGLNKEWSGFQEVEFVIFHQNAIMQASWIPNDTKNLPQYVLKAIGVVGEWALAQHTLALVLDPKVTKTVKVDITITEDSSEYLRDWSRAHWRHILLAVVCVFSGVAREYNSGSNDYNFKLHKLRALAAACKGSVASVVAENAAAAASAAGTGETVDQMEGRKGDSRLEFAGKLPKEHRAVFESQFSSSWVHIYEGAIDWI